MRIHTLRLRREIFLNRISGGKRWLNEWLAGRQPLRARGVRSPFSRIRHGSQGVFHTAILLCAIAVTARAQQVPVVEKTLNNGMRLLMVERHDEPTIAGGWVAHVGSSNEKLGMTGIAHLFEHMMFKGTKTIGTTDYKKDIDILAQQEVVRDEMRAEERNMRAMLRKGDIEGDLLKPENWTPRYKELQKQFADLVDQERKVIVKNEFD